MRYVDLLSYGTKATSANACRQIQQPTLYIYRAYLLRSPIQTYKGQGATKQGLIVDDHGVIHTTASAPDLLPGEKLTKYSVQVQPYKDERLEPESRVNYGKAYAVEHNVKLLEVGMVLEGHRYLIQQYFDSAMRSQ